MRAPRGPRPPIAARRPARRWIAGAARLLLGLALAALALWLCRPSPSPGARARSWEELLAPVAVGRTVRGHEVTSLRRGQEHDVVLTLRSPERGASIEVHVVDRGRWKGIRETASFGVAYEVPRSSASAPECEAVTEEITAAVRANDPGGLGPVESIPLPAEPPAPLAARALDTIGGPRGVAIGLCVVAATWLFASGPGGALVAATWLLALGLLLRAPHLDLPFARDQDVQRLFTGHLPLGEILTGQGLTDRHPPLYFLVLHAAQLFGQSESVARAPAVIAGALAGPALVWAARATRRSAAAGAMAGLAGALSVEMILRSREVSSIPLFGLIALASAVSLARLTAAPSRRWAVAVAASHALALWTYYTAVFLVAGNLLALLATGRLRPRTLRAIGAGVALGSPALLLGAITFLRDRGARAAAAAHPDLAWGSHAPRELTGQLASVLTGALGPVLAGLFVLCAGWALARRRPDALVPATAFAASFLGITLLSPVARVQPYYIVTVLPLALWMLAVPIPAERTARLRSRLATAILGGVVAVTLVPRLADGRRSYLPEPDAFMPGFVDVIAGRRERLVITVAHYDMTLLAYYLARRAGVPMDWSLLRRQPDGRFHPEGVDRALLPLIYVHSPGDDPDAAARAALIEVTRAEPALVLSREAMRLEGVSHLLAECDLLAKEGPASLFRCPAGAHR